MPSELKASAPRRWLPRGNRRFRAAGVPALEQLSISASVSADPPDRFRLEVTRTDLGEVIVERIRVTPFLLVGKEDAQPADPPTLSVCFVARGSIQFAKPADSTAGVGAWWVAVDGADIAFSARESVEVLRASTPLERFPPELLAACNLPRLTSERTAVSDGLFGLLRGVLDAPPPADPTQDGGSHLARAVSELVAATVDELVDHAAHASDDAADRIRALEYIEQHLAEPDTSPDTIAAALRIGRRRLYRLFQDDEYSIAGRIRQRRLDGVAAVLESSPTVPQIRGLAERFGFTSTDALTRNFRDRFGTSIREYHDRVTRPAD